GDANHLRPRPDDPTRATAKARQAARANAFPISRACSMKSLAIGLIVRPFSVTTPAGIDCLGNWTGRTLIGNTFALHCRNIRATPKTYPEGHFGNTPSPRPIPFRLPIALFLRVRGLIL